MPQGGPAKRYGDAYKELATALEPGHRARQERERETLQFVRGPSQAYSEASFVWSLSTEVHNVAGDPEYGYRFFVDAKHERYREVDGEQERWSDLSTHGSGRFLEVCWRARGLVGRPGKSAAQLILTLACREVVSRWCRPCHATTWCLSRP